MTLLLLRWGGSVSSHFESRHLYDCFDEEALAKVIFCGLQMTLAFS